MMSSYGLEGHGLDGRAAVVTGATRGTAEELGGAGLAGGRAELPS
jgi:hypothetical protein